MRDRFPISFQIHGTTYDASKTEKGLVVVREMFGSGVRFFDSENEFRVWAKPYLSR